MILYFLGGSIFSDRPRRVICYQQNCDVELFLWVYCTCRSSLIHIACIWVAPPRLVTPTSRGGATPMPVLCARISLAMCSVVCSFTNSSPKNLWSSIHRIKNFQLFPRHSVKGTTFSFPSITSIRSSLLCRWYIRRPEFRECSVLSSTWTAEWWPARRVLQSSAYDRTICEDYQIPTRDKLSMFPGTGSLPSYGNFYRYDLIEPFGDIHRADPECNGAVIQSN